MYQTQSFQANNFRNNQQSADAAFQSQYPSGFSGQSVTSQYRGLQKPFQPTGFVNSVYGQGNQSGYSSINNNAYQSAASFQNNNQYGTFVNPQSYHTANYRGDQPGHDNYLRADSTSPSQIQGGFSAGSMNASSYGTGSTFGGSQYQNQNQFVNPQSYHTANYRGDQAGHDNYLRADSTTPSQSGYNTGFASSSYGLGSASYGSSQIAGNQYQNQNQFVNPQSYHTANYRGNQPGHDNYLRSDSANPSQFGTGMSSGYSSNRNF